MSNRTDCNLIYRLKHWPQLPAGSSNACVWRALSVMSTRPVNRNWILMSSSLRPKEVDQLLRDLVAQGAVEVIDPAGFATPAPKPG